MAEERQRKRISGTGLVIIGVLGVITYVLVQSKSLLTLFTLATVLLVSLLVVVAFDIGVERTGQAPEEEEIKAEEPTIAPPSPPAKSRKRRRK